MDEHTTRDRDAESYEAPRITDYGSLAELTAATNTGAQTDAALPAHTPIAGHLS